MSETPLRGAVRTLLVMPNWVGDAVMALPVAEALAASGRRLSAFAKPHLSSLLRLHPAFADLVERAPDEATTLERLRAAACQEAVVLPNSFRSAWRPYRAAIPYRWGYSGELRGLLLRPAVPRPRGPRRPQIHDYEALLAAMGVEGPASWIPRLSLDEATRSRGAERLRRAHVEPGAGPLVGLFPGAEFGPSKRWPWQRFAALATEIRRAIPGARIVILAGPKELWLGVRVHEESGKLHPLVGPDLDLGGLAAVVSHLDLLVTNDSGPMHLAAALGVRCVALFGPTDPRRTAPAGEGHAVLYTDRWCSPCFQRRCPLLHHKCLRDITVEQVMRAANTVFHG
jgi:lipopolysaccharide heptosyltransferase II